MCGAKFKGRGPVEIFRLVEWSQETCFSGKAFRQRRYYLGLEQRIVLENKRFQGQSTIRGKLLSFYKILQAPAILPRSPFRYFSGQRKTYRLIVCGAKFKGRGPVEIFRLVEWSQETCFSGKAFRQATAPETHGKNDAFPAGWGQRIVLENKRFQGQSTIRAKLLSFYKTLQAPAILPRRHF